MKESRKAARPAIASSSVDEVARLDSRREILNAAAALLRQHGYKSTTLREIATAVGIKAGSIYYHFSSKDEIVAAVMNDGVDHVLKGVQDALAELPKSTDPGTRVEVAIRAHLEALLNLSDYTSAGLKAYADVPESVRSVARPHRRRYEAVWSELVRDLVDARQAPEGLSPEALTLAIFGMMNWSPEWYRTRHHRIEDIARDFAAIVVRPKPSGKG
jgi:TetR/AcrR family transcriptional regulator, cholesterol catabolism regulator